MTTTWQTGNALDRAGEQTGNALDLTRKLPTGSAVEAAP
jgi:hypothetical protein